MDGLGQALRTPSDALEELRSLSDDDLLLLAISYVKETPGDAPDFMRTVAVVFEDLKRERQKQSGTTT